MHLKCFDSTAGGLKCTVCLPDEENFIWEEIRDDFPGEILLQCAQVNETGGAETALLNCPEGSLGCHVQKSGESLSLLVVCFFVYLFCASDAPNDSSCNAHILEMPFVRH